MRYSSARIRHLAKKIVKKATEEGIIEIAATEKLVLDSIIETIEKYFSIEDEVYSKVLEDLQKRSKKLIPGSMEWKVAFNKAYEEEISRRLLK
ncbi:DUF507 family protein [Hippea maritima]|uniref:DUF507 family protein n=1 Tax=Hippea maritima (strain ATCC 700847 / DSM 10411 / MH2) TaxID=760142 RepID=F2LW13_HIPMA|nr:DUF507 family protein [Hippea maritima]AEA33947.1 protein of unknown function DUF507 [Hippea maritima DSM 10411]